MSDIEIIPGLDTEIVVGGVAEAGPRGADGAGATNNILYGTANPTGGTGMDGNFFINTATWTLFGPKAAGAWPSGVSMIGPAGANGSNGSNGATGPQGAAGADGKTVLNGTGAPDNGLGTNGDFYLATNTWTVYGPKAAGVWPAGQTLVGPTGAAGNDGAPGADGAAGSPGAAGADGRTLLNGTGAPSNGLGADGDFYIATDTWLIYGPKASGTWPSGFDLNGADGADGADGAAGAAGAAGADGKTVLSGSGAPTTEGVNGDFYIRTSDWTIYGPKAAGAWGSPTSLVGPTGATGAAGADGADGADGSPDITSTSPATPASGVMNLFRGRVGQSDHVGVINSGGKKIVLGKALQRRPFSFAYPVIGSTTLQSSGFTNSAEGTATAPTPTTTDILTRQGRVNYASVATASAICGWRDGGSSKWYNAVGYHLSYIFGFTDPATVANSRSFIGAHSSNGAALITTVNPSTLANLVGFGHDSGDTALQFMHNDGSGNATKVALTGFDPNAVNEVYHAEIYVAPNVAEVHYRIEKLSNGDVAQGMVSSDIPAMGTGLFSRMVRGNGDTALAVGIALIYHYCEREVG